MHFFSENVHVFMPGNFPQLAVSIVFLAFTTLTLFLVLYVPLVRLNRPQVPNLSLLVLGKALYPTGLVFQRNLSFYSRGSSPVVINRQLIFISFWIRNLMQKPKCTFLRIAARCREPSGMWMNEYENMSAYFFSHSVLIVYFPCMVHIRFEVSWKTTLFFI